MLMVKQAYYTMKVQGGMNNVLGQLRTVQKEIMDWYEEESRKIVIQSRVDDCQQSEKVRIFHHEQHQKHLKRSAILSLQTVEHGLLEG